MTPAPGTILGWEVEDVVSAVESLSADGVGFLRYDDLEQDDLGVATLPDGTRLAWFTDPDGNVLSLTEFAVDR